MFKINLTQLKVLANRCIPPVPIARAMFWENLIDVHYDLIPQTDRIIFFYEMMDNKYFVQRLEEDNEDAILFFNRYNPETQYEVTVEYEGKIQRFNAFLHNDEYHVSSRSRIHKDYIIKTTPLYFSQDLKINKSFLKIGHISPSTPTMQNNFIVSINFNEITVEVPSHNGTIYGHINTQPDQKIPYVLDTFDNPDLDKFYDQYKNEIHETIIGHITNINHNNNHE